MTIAEGNKLIHHFLCNGNYIPSIGQDATYDSDYEYLDYHENWNSLIPACKVFNNVTENYSVVKRLEVVRQK